MNLLGTHDTERILTCLGMTDEERMRSFSNPEKAEYKLSEEQYSRAVKLLKIASAIQYTVYGVPSLYYGDETGMEGFGDPFCRMPYPWGRENEELLEHYKALGRIRESESVLKNGDFRGEVIGENTFMFSRTAEAKRGKKEKLTVIACRAPEGAFVSLDGKYKDLVGGELYDGEITVDADTAVVLKKI
jgi:4-alpha-glucanotransferase